MRRPETNLQFLDGCYYVDTGETDGAQYVHLREPKNTGEDPDDVARQYGVLMSDLSNLDQHGLGALRQAMRAAQTWYADPEWSGEPVVNADGSWSWPPQPPCQET